MIFLPIVGRELRVASRRKWTYWNRLALGILAFLFSLWSVQAEFQFRNPSSVGRSIFTTLTALAFIFSLASGAWITADTISRERREGTLGLLFLTDLKGYDVVLGKLAATSLNSFYGLIAIFPVLALSLLFGGVTAGEFWRMALALLLILLFSLSAGLLVSSLIQEQSKTIGWTLLVIGSITLGPMAAATLASATSPETGLLWLSPAYLFQTALEAEYQRPGSQFWGSFCFLGFLTLSLLAAAAWITPRSLHQRPAAAGERNLTRRWREWSLGSEVKRRDFRTRLLNLNPVSWLAARSRVKAAFVWVFLGLVALAWGISALTAPRLAFDISTCLFISDTLHLVLKVWAASEAGQLFAVSRQNSSLELLLTTPIQVREILRGQILALRWQFFKPVMLILALDLTLFAFALRQDNTFMTPLFVAAGMIFLVLDLYTIAYVAMWLGLKTKHASRASAGAAARILLLPWAAVLFLMIFGGGFPQWQGMVVASLLTRGFVDYVMFFIYYSNLQQDFRKLAADESRTPADYNDNFGLLSDPLETENIEPIIDRQ